MRRATAVPRSVTAEPATSPATPPRHCSCSRSCTIIIHEAAHASIAVKGTRAPARQLRHRKGTASRRRTRTRANASPPRRRDRTRSHVASETYRKKKTNGSRTPMAAVDALLPPRRVVNKNEQCTELKRVICGG